MGPDTGVLEIHPPPATNGLCLPTQGKPRTGVSGFSARHLAGNNKGLQPGAQEEQKKKGNQQNVVN